ncbi:MAG: hypothetical protein IJ173_00760 [Kiritimatiellae bacterium]|nr:hypothetical protein [Kiritimatiellia bacterium]
MRKIISLPVFALAICFSLFGESNPNLADQLWATTNLWGEAATMTQYRCVILPGLIAKMQGDEQYDETLRDWYCALAHADDSLETGDRWCVVKGEMLHRYSYLPSVAASTNAWLAAADFLGRLRAARVAVAGGGAAVTHRLLTADELAAFNDIAARKGAFYRGKNVMDAVGRIEPLVLNAVTNAFPSVILTNLDPVVRQTMCSNVVERAELTDEEAAFLMED